MKFAAVADLHITDKCPVNRKDDYVNTCLRKFEEILEISWEEKCEALVIGGDVFDYPTVPRWVVTTMLIILRSWEKKWKNDHPIRILAIPGQHDLRYHRVGLDNTPLGNLIASGCVESLHPEHNIIISGVSFKGKGWGETIVGEADVLVTHEMVTKKGPLWPGHTDYISAAGIMNKYPEAKCIISGDNHIPHNKRTLDGRTQINCGSIMRSKKDQIDHEPVVWIIDTENYLPKSFRLDIEPAKDVFDFKKIAIEETKKIARDEAQEKIDAFVDSFGHKKGEKADFKLIVKKIMDDDAVKKSVVDIANGILEKVS